MGTSLGITEGPLPAPSAGWLRHLLIPLPEKGVK